jgi:uncharacterized membrane protein YphA (DoxX/SURF4 family)
VKQIALAIRILLAGIFLYSGLIKASSSAQFAIALAPFTFLPSSWLRPLSLMLPVCEIIAGALTLTPRVWRIGAGLIIVLCILFAMVLGWALANGIIVSCSCFGEEEEPSALKMAISLLRDLVLAALGLIALGIERRLSNASRIQ